MKSIITSILAIFIFGIIATGFSQKPLNKNRILIQSTDSKMSEAVLSQSAGIIIKRLKSFSEERFDVTTIPAKNQIQIILYGSWDRKIVESLVTQKGSLAFYETYFYKELQELLKGDTTMFSISHAETPRDSTVRIVCTTTEGVSKLNKYLNSVGVNQICKFAWSNLFDDTSPCLFALKPGDGSGLNLKGSDIESYTCGQDSIWKINYLGFTFKTASVPVWAEITKRNINRSVALVLDDHVIFAPVVRETITGGNCQLSGGFTQNEVKYIASVCENGELPVGFKIVK
jgi:hypothetical protein